MYIFVSVYAHTWGKGREGRLEARRGCWIPWCCGELPDMCEGNPTLASGRVSVLWIGEHLSRGPLCLLGSVNATSIIHIQSFIWSLPHPSPLLFHPKVWTKQELPRLWKTPFCCVCKSHYFWYIVLWTTLLVLSNWVIFLSAMSSTFTCVIESVRMSFWAE